MSNPPIEQTARCLARKLIALLSMGAFLTSAGVALSYDTLEEAYAALSFDPNAEGAAVFVAAADVHYGSTDGILPIITEMNAMNPAPAFFTILGDMVTSASHSPGLGPTATDRQKAIQQYEALKEDLTQLNPAIPVRLVIGNHDQAPGHGDPDMFWTVFPDRPAYGSFTVAGVHFIKLNGHQDGYLDDVQQTWLKAEVAALPAGSTVAILVHQPALGAIVNERGIAMAVAEAFATHTGPLWLFAGHHHRNFTSVYQLPETTVVQAAICNGATGVFGSDDAPGYVIYGLRDGNVVGRIYRELAGGFRIEPEPDRSSAQPLPLPWKGVNHVGWKLFIGHEDEPYYVQHNGGRHAVTWWHNPTQLTYRLPRSAVMPSAVRVGVLAGFPSVVVDDQQFSLSSDGTNWTSIATVERVAASHYLLDIPTELRQEEIYVKIVNPTPSTIWVGGFALLDSTIPDPYPLSPPNGDLLAWFTADAGSFTTATGSSRSGDGDPVGRWEDQSGNGYHLRRSGTDLPTLSTASGPSGRPALHFDGVAYLLMSTQGWSANAVAFPAGTEIGTAFAVFRPASEITSATPGQVLLSYVKNNILQGALMLGNTTSLLTDEVITARDVAWNATAESWVNVATGWSEGSLPNDTYTYLHVQFAENTFNLRTGLDEDHLPLIQNGTPDGWTIYNSHGNTNPTPATPLTLTVGGVDGSYPRFAGHLSEIILYRAVLTGEEITAVEDYLAEKYRDAPLAPIVQIGFSGSELDLTWGCISGHTYAVHRRDDLSTGDWETVSTALVCDESGTLAHTESATPSRRFFRIADHGPESP